MGFSSGLPLALTGSTLAIRLAEEHVSLSAIGYFSLATVAYNLKFVWAPAIDRVPIPLLTAWLGRRRSWSLLIQTMLAVAILSLGRASNLAATAAWASLVAFLSASQDIVIDAYRVELLPPDRQGAGAAATQLGYRLGMIAAGAGALLVAERGGWAGAYATMAALVGVGMVTVLLTPEPTVAPPRRGESWFGDAVVAPFAEFVRRRNWVPLAIFVVLYNLGDAVAGHMTGPFYLSLGFSKGEIAEISKLFGVLASIVGVVLGGLVVYRIGVVRALLWLGVLKALSTLLYVVQARLGHDVAGLTMTIAAENVAGGMASSAFVAYLSSLCNPAFTATQYALLSALAAEARTLLSSSSGALAEALGWSSFFVSSALLGLPALLLIVWIGRGDAGGSFGNARSMPVGR